MAENNSDEEKTYDPTEQSIKRAQERGQFAISRDLVTFVILLVAFGIITIWLPLIVPKIALHLQLFLSCYDLAIIPKILTKIAMMLLGPLLLFWLVTIFMGLVQTRFQVSIAVLMPKLSRIGFSFKKIFSVNNIFEWLKGFIKLSAISAATFFSLQSFYLDFRHWGFRGLQVFGYLFNKGLLKLWVPSLLILGSLALLDLLYQRFNYRKQLRMSREELKKELKETEGDPLIKGRIARIRRERYQSRMFQALETATAVITNPEHYAVALKYDPATMNAPKVVAKGTELMAQKIIELARSKGIPVLRNPPLARGLYKVKLDQEIPTQYYKAVAEIIRFIMGLKEN